MYGAREAAIMVAARWLVPEPFYSRTLHPRPAGGVMSRRRPHTSYPSRLRGAVQGVSPPHVLPIPRLHPMPGINCNSLTPHK